VHLVVNGVLEIALLLGKILVHLLEVRVARSHRQLGLDARLERRLRLRLKNKRQAGSGKASLNFC